MIPLHTISTVSVMSASIIIINPFVIGVHHICQGYKHYTMGVYIGGVYIGGVSMRGVYIGGSL
jgi:hypothetical protein